MYVLIIVNGISPFQLGGIQTHSRYLLEQLSKQKVRIDLLVSCSVNNKKHVENWCDNLTIKNKIKVKVFVEKASKELPGHYVRKAKILSRRMYEYCAEKINNYDLIYAKSFLTWEFVNQREKGNIKIPVIVNFHGLEMFQIAPDLKSKIQQYLILRNSARNILLKSDYQISYGGKITDILKRVGCKSIIEIPSGIESNWIINEISTKNKTDKIKIVFVGRYEKRKGLLDISNLLSQKNDELKCKMEFHFIGVVPSEIRVLDSNIFYYDEIREEQNLKQILDKMDVLLCPSYSEGMPNVIMEAMARGLAIIATDVGAINLLVGNDNGILIDNPKSESIYKGLLRLQSKDLASLKISSLAKINHYTWDRIIEITINEFNKVLSN